MASKTHHKAQTDSPCYSGDNTAYAIAINLIILFCVIVKYDSI